jgi:hypothetical protein
MCYYSVVRFKPFYILPEFTLLVPFSFFAIRVYYREPPEHCTLPLSSNGIGFVSAVNDHRLCMPIIIVTFLCSLFYELHQQMAY